MPTATVSESDPVTSAPGSLTDPLGGRRILATRRFDAEPYAEHVEALMAV
jgi:hypothetical protein